MKLIQCRFSSGQRVPLLAHAGNAELLPVLVPFICIQLKLRHRAYNTASVQWTMATRFLKQSYSYVRGRSYRGERAQSSRDGT